VIWCQYLGCDVQGLLTRDNEGCPTRRCRGMHCISLINVCAKVDIFIIQYFVQSLESDCVRLRLLCLQRQVHLVQGEANS
jgi:hypothetical protein